MSYQDDLYSKYVTTHTSSVYGKTTKENMVGHFPTLSSYFEELLPKNKEAKILDIGCGNGEFVYWLNSLRYKNARGIDLSEEQIEEGRSLGILNIEKGDVFGFLAGHAGEWDAIVARDLLEHIPKGKVLDLLKTIHTSLSADGSFIFQTVNAENLLWGRLRHGDFTHENAFTENSAHQILSAAGFKKISVSPQRPVAHGLVSLIRCVLWRGFEFLTRLYLLIETGSSRGIFTQNILVVANK